MIIRGAGGGGKGKGGGRLPVEAPDSLRSKAFASVLDLVSEGPIKGPAKPGLEWVFLDGVPLENQDGSLNFKDVSVGWVLGTQTQAYIDGFSDVESETAVGVEVKFGVPVVRTVNDSSIDRVRVTVYTPNLTDLNTKNGDISGTEVQIKIEVQNNGAGYVEVLTDKISGKTTSGYERNYVIPLPKPGGPWDIKITRLTADSSRSSLQNNTFWQRYTLINDVKLSYPNSALVGVSIDSAQFQNIPTRGYELDLIVCRVPSNYDPVARTYTGNWDGNFKLAWTNNPVWCFYDFVTNKRYGCGKRLTEENLDKWALYTVAQYCDGWVATGKKKRATVSTGSVSLSCRAIQISATVSSFTGNTVYRPSGSWITDGFAPGDTIFVTGSLKNNGFYTVLSRTANTLTIRETFSNETVAATVQNSRAKHIYSRTTGSFVSDGFLKGDQISASGFVAATNNGRAIVSDVSALDLTVEEKTITNESAASGRTLQLVDPTEPRFVCNVYWQVADNAYRTIAAMASIFNALVYWGNNMLQVVQDCPKSASLLFNNTNVKKGTFKYSSAGVRATHTVALVQWVDPDDGYKPKVECVEDPTGIALYGVRTITVPAVGCTSQGQAQRFGRMILYTERAEPELISFEGAMEGIVARPGEIFKVIDNDRRQVKQSGRVKLVESSIAIVLDNEIDFVNGESYTFSVMNPDGTISDYAMTNLLTKTDRIELATPLTQIPVENAIWLISTSAYAATKYRLLSITDKSTEEEINYEFLGMLYDESKFALVEDNMLLQTQGATYLASRFPISGLTLSEYHVATAKGTKHVVTAGWTQQNGARSYSIQWRRNNAEWVTIPEVASPYVEFEVPELGYIEVRVSAVYITGQSTPTQASYTMVGKDTNPSDPTNLVCTMTSQGISISWDKNPEGDVIGYELRFGNTSSTWATSSALVPFIQTTRFLWEQPAGGSYKIYVRALDASGNTSNAVWQTVAYSPTTPATITMTVSSTVPGD